MCIIAINPDGDDSLLLQKVHIRLRLDKEYGGVKTVLRRYPATRGTRPISTARRDSLSAATFGSGSRQSQNASRDLRAENGALCWRGRFCDLVLDYRRACRYTVAIRSKGAAIIEFQEESMGTAGSLSTFRRGSAHARLAFPPLVPEACAGAEARTQEAARRGESNRRRT
jgi:hypothetical protein